MGTKPLSWFEAHWGQRYLGWAEGFNGVRIPGLGDRKPTASASRPATDRNADGTAVSLSNLRWGIKHDDVKVYQKALRAKGFANLNPSGVTGLYGAETKAMTAAFQRAQGWSGDDADGFPGRQTLKLLGLAAR
jgi:peptidoglycan hydrolase-like protein with peptidoglycan-binding domain